jgi:hypothetical protein
MTSVVDVSSLLTYAYPRCVPGSLSGFGIAELPGLSIQRCRSNSRPKSAFVHGCAGGFRLQASRGMVFGLENVHCLGKLRTGFNTTPAVVYCTFHSNTTCTAKLRTHGHLVCRWRSVGSRLQHRGIKVSLVAVADIRRIRPECVS